MFPPGVDTSPCPRTSELPTIGPRRANCGLAGSGLGALLGRNRNLSERVLETCPGILSAARLRYLRVQKFRIVVKTRRNRPRIVRNRCVTVPVIWGLVWPRFRPKSGLNSKISGRIRKSVRGPFSSAESGVVHRQELAECLPPLRLHWQRPTVCLWTCASILGLRFVCDGEGDQEIGTGYPHSRA